MQIEKYFKEIETKVRTVYSVAEEARSKGLDPKSNVEIPLAVSLAERALALISVKYPQIKDKRIVNRILQLEKKYGKLDPAVCLIIAEEVAKEKFCKFKNLQEAIDAGIRLAFAYYTLGVVVPPLEGFTHYELKKTMEGKDYFCVYFSGPIRAAGTTAGAFILVVIDYLRYKFGYAKYDPTDIEIKREIMEVYDYHERITNLQYLASEQELEFLLKHLPIQIDGFASEVREVSNYKDLPRIETNFIRNGMCLVLSESLAQKAPKVLRFIEKLKKQGFEFPDWDFLKEYVSLKKKWDEQKKKEDSTATYIKDLVAGRPVFGHPSMSGSFRLRYGRTRTNGFSAMSIHPATMIITNGFIANGTQLKIEKPTKGCAVSCCDSIDGPIVKLNNGNVLKLNDTDKANQLYKDVKEIIYLGDILIPYADFLNRNQHLEPQAYIEQYWYQHLKTSAQEKNIEIPISKKEIYDVGFEKAIKLSKKFEIPLHPDYIYYWTQISYEDFLALIDWLSHSRIDKKLIFPFNKTEQERFAKGKRALELLGVEHEVVIENVVLNEENSKAFLCNLGFDFNLEYKKSYFLEQDVGEIEKLLKKRNNAGKVLEIINDLCDFEIKDKAGTFIGARMGRPEKAKLRKLTGSPNVLFPVGEEGGRFRSVNAAIEVGTVKADFPIYFCDVCKKETIYFICETCGSECRRMNFCSECHQTFSTETCPHHAKAKKFSNRRIDIKHYADTAIKNLNISGLEIPELVKGVRGTSSKDHVPENLSKGFLRAFFDLNVNKDGTIRYDATELPITHFKAIEIGTSIEKLKELGYTKDIEGKELKTENQILELLPHDILFPACPVALDEGADSVFIRICNFVDELLIKYYNLRPFYNVKKKEDLIGHLVVCMAPHNAAGVIGRIIGFSKVQAMFASPFMHAGMRRDCDGDEAAFILLLDCLINFSREYLPGHRGATQDAPLVLNMKLNPGEVDDQIFDFDVFKELPLEFYESTEKREHSATFSDKLDLIGHRVSKSLPAFKNLYYEYETSNINAGVLCSSYKILPTMQEKVQRQMELVEKIRAVYTADVARLIIERHFIRDIRGNLRKFSMQQFRCSKCNTKYRRPPLEGRCSICGGNIIFTISEGSIIKYLKPALELAAKYEVSPYLIQSLDLAKKYVESIFGKEKEQQEELKRWF